MSLFETSTALTVVAVMIALIATNPDQVSCYYPMMRGMGMGGGMGGGMGMGAGYGGGFGSGGGKLSF